MPNHVENDLRVSGPLGEIKRFFATVKSETHIIDANHLIPYPKAYADADKASNDYRKKHPLASWSSGPQDGYHSGGYEWCIENWGTKWGMYDFSEVKYFTQSAVVSFNTAWAPALPLITKMSELFPQLTFTLKYYERGCEFKGVFKIKNNVIIQDETARYNGPRGG